VPWFRGEPDAAARTSLQPRLYRERGKLKDILYEERELRLEFWRRGVQLIAEQRPADKWERYFLMQHYGVPSRLLDWSDGSLVALYFAVCEDKNDRTDAQQAAVYILDPRWLSERAFEQWPTRAKDRPHGVALPDWDEAKEYLPEELDNKRLGPELPLCIDPTHVARRVAAQRSRFVVFGRKRDGLRTLCGDGRDKTTGLACIRIRRSSARSIRRELAMAGISESTIFPHLEGLGRELHDWWKDRHRNTSG